MGGGMGGAAKGGGAAGQPGRAGAGARIPLTSMISGQERSPGSIQPGTVGWGGASSASPARPACTSMKQPPRSPALTARVMRRTTSLWRMVIIPWTMTSLQGKPPQHRRQYLLQSAGPGASLPQSTRVRRPTKAWKRTERARDQTRAGSAPAPRCRSRSYESAVGHQPAREPREASALPA